jgi:hypothetical protein
MLLWLGMLLRLCLSFLLLLWLSMLLRLSLSPLLLLWLGMLLRLCLGPLLLLWLSVLLRLRLSPLLLLWLGVLLRLCLSPLLLLWLGMLLRLCLSFLLLLWLSMLLRLRLSPLLLLWLSVLLRLCLDPLLLLWLSMLLRLRLSPLLLLWLGVLLWLCLGPLLLLLWPWLGSGASRNYRSDRSACRDGLRRCKFGRPPMIDGGKLLAVLCCRSLVLQLRGHGRNALPTQCGGFGRQSLASDASRPVVAGAVHGGIVDGAVIHVNVGDVYIVDGPVIVETISAPIPALIAGAEVAESIVNTAVVADILAPEAVVVLIHAAKKSPISGRPQEAHLRRPRPGAGHPVVALRSIAPISGRPQISIAGALRLRIFRQRRWGFLCLKHRLAVGRLLVAAIAGLAGPGVPPVHRPAPPRRLLIVLLRRLVCWLLLIVGTGRLGPVRGGKVGRIGGILRLIGLCRLTLGAVVGGVGFIASYNSKRQCDECGCQNDKRRYFVRHIPPDGDAERGQLHLITLYISCSFGSVQKGTLPPNGPFEILQFLVNRRGGLPDFRFTKVAPPELETLMERLGSKPTTGVAGLHLLACRSVS